MSKRGAAGVGSEERITAARKKRTEREARERERDLVLAFPWPL